VYRKYETFVLLFYVVLVLWGREVLHAYSVYLKLS
jgi:hypothetical protein